MPGDISRSYKGPKTGAVPSWMDEPSPPTLARPKQFKLMTHENQHGFGVSLMVYEGPEFQNGFTLITMPDEAARDKYVRELIDLTGFALDAP